VRYVLLIVRPFFLTPRLVVGSDNNTFVRHHITAALGALNWHVEEDSFTEYTPYGQRSFTNIIATKDPTALRRIIISAHYDSKFFSAYPENQVPPGELGDSLCR
jgi:glutaminyl-peptide cyclotransferase